MPTIKHTHELVFDLKSPGCFRPVRKHDFRSKPEPENQFPGDPEEKLRRIEKALPQQKILTLALEAVRLFYFNDRNENNPFRQKHGLYRQRYAETRGQENAVRFRTEDFLRENLIWKERLETSSLKETYEELIRPLMRIIENTINKTEEETE